MAAAPGKDSNRSRRRLGRGLDSLLAKPVAVDVESSADLPRQPDTDTPGRSDTDASRAEQSPVPDAPGREPPGEAAAGEDQLRMVSIDAIRPNRHQPRRAFDEPSLESLAESIRSAGMMQPVVLRHVQDGQYELVAGERRWRAARMVNIQRIPAIVRSIDEQTAAELALVENLQREDLNPIERAEAFQHLADVFGLTHQAIAERVGLKRASITNHLRLLELDDNTRAALESGQLTLGHARALLAITNNSRRQSLARKVIARDWSVRELERRIQRQGDGQPPAPSTGATPGSLPPHLADLQTRLGEHLGTKVRIQPGRKKGAGRLVIDFYSLDEFEGLLQRMRFPNE